MHRWGDKELDDQEPLPHEQFASYQSRVPLYRGSMETDPDLTGEKVVNNDNVQASKSDSNSFSRELPKPALQVDAHANENAHPQAWGQDSQPRELYQESDASTLAMGASAETLRENQVNFPKSSVERPTLELCPELGYMHPPIAVRNPFIHFRDT